MRKQKQIETQKKIKCIQENLKILEINKRNKRINNKINIKEESQEKNKVY